MDIKNNDYDEKFIEDFIRNIKKHFPNNEIDSYNVNDYALVLEEKGNCRNCKNIDDCKNMTKGFCHEIIDEKLSVLECRYKKDLNNKNNQDNLIKTLYMPLSIREYNFENFDLNSESRKKIYRQALNFINEYGKNEVKGLYLYGNNSIGKTYTLSCIANELAKSKIKSLLIYFPDLVSDLKQALQDDRFTNLVNMLKTVDVLMLDDFGAENMTPWLRDEILGPVLNYRALEHKPVFISSNISPNEIRGHLAIDKLKSSEVKANRILSRLTSLAVSINMDDSNKYER